MAQNQSENLFPATDAIEPPPTPNEAFMADEIRLRQAQKKQDQAKQNTKTSVQKIGGQAAKAATKALAPELGPIGGFLAKKAGEKVAGQAFDKAGKSGALKPLTEAAQAATLNKEKGGKGGAPDIKDVGKELLKKQGKKIALRLLLNPATWWAMFIAFIVFIIAFVLGLTLFCIIAMYSCYQQKGLIGKTGTLINSYWNPSALLQEWASGTCGTSNTGTGKSNTIDATPKAAAPAATTPEVTGESVK